MLLIPLGPVSVTVVERALAGVLIAGAIAFAARRRGALDGSGVIGAIALGTLTMAAGWSWGALMIAFFVSSTLLAKTGEATRAERVADVIAKSGARDVRQVMANGGLLGVAALLWLLTGWMGFMAVGAGALAAATADTWATEVGTLVEGQPRLITTWQPVPAGTSGAVTAAGLTASLCGAVFLSLASGIVGWPHQVTLGALVGGISGALADSFIGARWQGYRRCPSCDALTERHVHRCGSPTEEAGGVKWLDNDAVNLLATACGGAVSLAWWMTR